MNLLKKLNLEISQDFTLHDSASPIELFEWIDIRMKKLSK